MPDGYTRAEGTRASKITRNQKRRRILSLYAAGATQETISEQTGYSVSSVGATIRSAVVAFRDDTTKSVESVRVTQQQRLDELLMAVWPAATGQLPADPSDPAAGKRPVDLAAVREVLRIEALRSKIAGTERAPEGAQAGGDVHFHLADAGRVAELQASFVASSIDGTATEIPPDTLPAGD